MSLRAKRPRLNQRLSLEMPIRGLSWTGVRFSAPPPESINAVLLSGVFLWMSVRVGRLEGLAKEASDVRFHVFNEACARLIAVLPRILDSAIRVRANAFCGLCDRLYYENGNCLVTSDIIQPRVNKPGID